MKPVGGFQSRLADWRDVRSGLIVESICESVLRLSEDIVSAQERSLFYLLSGNGCDILVDGGWGFARSLDAVRHGSGNTLTAGKPLIAVATHSHYDHIGLLHLADTRYGHAAEAKVFAHPTPQATQALPFLEDLPALADGAAFDPASIFQQPCPLTTLIDDGDRIEAGGVALTVLHTPGHSPGSISLLDERRGLLFPADTVHDGHIWDDIPGSDREALLMSHRRLAEVDFALACPGHGRILDRNAFLSRIERYRRDAGA